MKTDFHQSVLTTGLALFIGTGFFFAHAADWPQWRGSNRDGKADAFKAPQTWPASLNQKWKVNIGPGLASPAVVGGKVYLFARDQADEIVVCLNAETGQEVWRDKYESGPATGPAGRHPGPRSSPTVMAGKVVTYGVRGTLSCIDAATGKVLWRKKDFADALPRFFTSCSPLVTDGLCIVQLGGEENGAIVAYNLDTGEEKWRWTGDGSAYSSPVLCTLDGTRMIVAMTARKLVGVRLTDGKPLWETPFVPQQRAYNAATPIVDSDTVYFAGAGRGTRAIKIEKSGDGFSVKELWTNPDCSVQFNTPVLKGGKLYGIAQNGSIFCVDAKEGKTLWTAQFGGRDFGSVVDAGNVLFAITPQSELTAFEPSDREYKKLASYKVAQTDVYAHPVIVGNSLFIKDQDSIALWTIE